MFRSNPKLQSAVRFAVLDSLILFAAANWVHAATIVDGGEDTTTQANFVSAGYATDGYALLNTTSTSKRSGYGYPGDPLNNNVNQLRWIWLSEHTGSNQPPLRTGSSGFGRGRWTHNRNIL
jgi:hypothetical protein